MNHDFFCFNTTAKRVKMLRTSLDMSQKDVVEALNDALGLTGKERLSDGYISNIEAKDVTPPARNLVALANVLGTTTDYLLLRTNNPQDVREPVHA